MRQRKVSGRKSKPPPQLHLSDVPETRKVGVYYLEDKEVKQALRVIAAEDGHNSLGKVIRNAVRQYLETRDPERWKKASNG